VPCTAQLATTETLAPVAVAARLGQELVGPQRAFATVVLLRTGGNDTTLMPVTILFTLPSLSLTSSKLPRVLAICKALDRQRFQPLVSVDHAGRVHPDELQLLTEMQVPVCLMRMSPHRRDFARSLLEMTRTPRVLRRSRVVIQHSSDYSRWWTEPLVARLGGVKYWIATKTTPNFSSYHWRIRLAFADRIVAQSPTMARVIECQVPSAISRVVVIPNGVDTQFFRPRKDIAGLRSQLGLRPSSLVLGYVAHLVAYKDHLSLIRALSLAVHKNIEILLIGRSVDPSYEQKVRNLVHELGLDERVHFLGLRNDVSRLHCVMDGIVLASRGDSLSNAVLEGMSSGLPVISSDCGGMRDAVEIGVNGWLIPIGPGFVQALAKAIDDWASDPERRRRYGQASRRLVIERFSLDRMVQAHIALYESLLEDLQGHAT